MRLAGALACAAALFTLNAALTFQNVWPTPAVRLPSPPELSPELAAVLALLVALAAWRARRGRGGAVPAALLASATLVLALGRYAEVTAPALYGRPVNLYWDAPHLGNVARMLAEAAGPPTTLLATLAAAGVLLGAWWLLRLAWARVADALATGVGRTVLGAVAGVALAIGLAQAAGHGPPAPRLALPVTATYAEQARLVAHAWRTARADRGEAGSPPGPGTATASRDGAVDPRLHALGGDDVLLVFLESYGSAAWTDPGLSARLRAPRAELERAVAAAGRAAVSATVRAPTFGGSSWLSHLSLLAGRDVRDPGAYARTMQGDGDTLVRDFARAGYRTLALMPGLRHPWPEGAYYGFDAILGAAAIDYRGPEFGWWRIPDQYALAKLERGATRPVADDARAPRFVFFPTISTHAPFRPTPPYQPDWERVLGPVPFGPEADAARALAPDWMRLAPAYGDAVAYALQWLGGYLRWRGSDAPTLVVVGDHQPPAAVVGASDDWTVPVHVISSRGAVLEALRAAGFVDGIARPPVELGGLHELRPRLLRAFRGTAPASVHAPRVDVAGGPAVRAVEQPPT